MRESPNSNRFDRDVLNAFDDNISDHQRNCKTVMNGNEEKKGLNHYGELQLIFERVDGTVEVKVYVNHLTRETSPDFFTTDGKKLADTKVNRDFRTVLSEAISPLDIQDIEVVEDESMTPSGSGWDGFRVR